MSDTPLPTAHPESINALLAAYLSTQKVSIADELQNRLRKTDLIDTEALSNSELRDHVPRIIDNMTRELLHYGNADIAKQTHIDALKHGDTRWRQGFDLLELLRESGQLRSIFIRHLCQFEEANPSFGFAARYFANSTLHHILDEVMIDAVDQHRMSKATGGDVDLSV
jgi:hypothetical protein